MLSVDKMTHLEEGLLKTFSSVPSLDETLLQNLMDITEMRLGLLSWQTLLQFIFVAFPSIVLFVGIGS